MLGAFFPGFKMKAQPSLEEETVTVLADLEIALRQILSTYPDNDAARSRLTHLLAMTDRVRELLAAQWSYLEDPPPSRPAARR